MAGSLLPQPRQIFQDSAWNPGIAYQIYTYAAGSLTPKDTYKDAALTTPNTNPVICNARGEVVMFGNEQYRVILKDSLGSTVWDQDNVESASSAVSTAIAALNSSLAANTGAALVGCKVPSTGFASRTVQDKLADWLTAADIAGVDATGETECTAALTTFMAAAAAKGYGIDLSGKFKVTNLVLPAGNLRIRGDCTLIGATTGTYSSVLEIKNATDLTVDGRILVSGSYNTGYAAGVKVWADVASGCSLLDLKGISVSSAQVAWQIGDMAQADRLLSEITITAGYTYGCPTAALIIGTQTFVNFVGYNLRADYGSGTGGWLALPLKTIISVGGTVLQTGGELLQTTSATGAAIELRPITSGTFPNSYGTYRGDCVTIECAAPFLVTANPGSVASPVFGLGSFVGCTGIHTQNAAALIQTDAQFTGDLVFSANDFYCTTPRTQQNIQAGGNCNIWCDDKSFGRNFLPALKGIGGAGIPHFSTRLVLSASNLSSQSLPNATQTTLMFQSLDNTGDLARFASAYSATTGIFTVPTGGLKNVQILFQIVNAGLTSGEVYIQLNNTTRGYVNCNKFTQAMLNLPSLVAGDQIKVVLFNVASGALTGTGGALDFLQITASN